MDLDQFDFSINPQAPLFVIGVVSEMVDLPIWTLRKLDEMGVVEPKRLNNKTRSYSQLQVKKLNYIRYLLKDKGVNISGIKIILEMEEKDLG